MVETTSGKKSAEDNPEKNLKYNGEVLDKKRTKPGELPCKVFEARNSPLTDLWEDKHVRTVYHICIAFLLNLFLTTAASDFLKNGNAKLGFNLIIKGFSTLPAFMFIWTVMLLTSLGVYYGFKFWATLRVQLTPKSIQLQVWDRFCLGLFIIFYPTFAYSITLMTARLDLSIALGAGILMEMTRFLMKTHAFVRSNAPRALKYKAHSTDEILYPELSKFFYFSFAPTALYQDDYPRTKQIRWNYVGIYVMEFMATLFFMSFLLERFFIPSFENYGKQSFTWQEMVVTILEHGVPSLLFLLSIFYLMLHVWMNIFAEILRFSDKMFYKDWWLSPNYERYYRTWNVVVHDWLYRYIYKDFYEIVTPKNKIAAKYMVFFMSALFHDYILGFAFKFYLPILFLQFFGIGTIMSFLKIKQESVGNILLWYTLACGNGINFSLYCMEYYARQNCPIENVTISSYFVPRLLSCRA